MSHGKPAQHRYKVLLTIYREIEVTTDYALVDEDGYQDGDEIARWYEDERDRITAMACGGLVEDATHQIECGDVLQRIDDYDVALAD